MEPLTTKDSKSKIGKAAERRVQIARAALLYEHLWPRAWPLVGIVLVFLGISWFDLWRLVPGYVHGLLLLPFFAFAGLAIWHVARDFRWPTRQEGIAKLERDSGLTHQPLQALGDQLALGARDQASLALWRAHQARAAGKSKDVRTRAPRPDIPGADPYALRILAVAFAVLGLLYAGPDWSGRIAAALHPDLSLKGAQQASVDAWITPPTYTQTPPIFLTGAEAGNRSNKIVVPKGSVLTVRVAGVERAPHIRRHIKANAPKDWRATLPLTADGAGAFKIDVPLGLDETVDVFTGQRRLDRWEIALTPDAPPAIAFKEAPVVNDKNLIGIAFAASDDYAVASVELRVQLADKSADNTADRDLSLADAETPVVIPLNLPGAHAKQVSGKQMIDLLAHPWAGLEVTLTLAATDEAGQTALSAPQKLKLPERDFREPLARALVEQRRNLAMAPRANRDRVQTALDALALAPEKFTPDVTVYLGLRSAYHRLSYALTKESLQSVYDLLWNLALHVEDGDLTLAEQSLRDIQNQLMSALSRNASDDQIQQLMAQLRNALDRYMRALADQAEKAIARGDIPPEAAPNADVLTSQDFRDLMQAIEDMAKTGARDQARELLSQLQDVLNNLRVGGSSQMSESEQAMSQALKGLSDIIQDQKQMLDETYRRSGRGAAPQKSDRTTNGLARDQAQLRERLNQLKSKLGQSVPQGNQSFDNAGEAMGDAQDALSGGDANSAVSPETAAIDELQKGMQGLAQALAQSMGGRLALSGSQGSNRDPLGRRRGGNGSIADDNVQVPEEMQLQRARRILEEIQRRASDPNRDAKELDYLERLLRRFN